MWGEYAKDPRMKANIGIRRRLAPLLDNDINQMELFTALLLSLPGSPVLYYGDEIGMGDNIWLGDRDGVRTPMQWTAGPQRRLLGRDPGPAAPAGDPGPGLRLPARQRGDRARERLVAAALDPADDPRPQEAPGLRPRRRSPTSAAPTRACSATCASTPTPTAAPTRCSASTTCPASRSRSSSTCAASRASPRSSCSAACGSREIGELPYLLTLGAYGFYWFRLPQPGQAARRGGPDGEASARERRLH